MANIRLPHDEKKGTLRLSIKNKYISALKSTETNISSTVEKLIVDYLKKNNRL